MVALTDHALDHAMASCDIVVRFGGIEDSWSANLEPTSESQPLSFAYIRVRMPFLRDLVRFEPNLQSCLFQKMIYITAFILTLFLSHIARALPRGCDDLIAPELDGPRGHSYGDGDGQYTIPNPVPVAQYKVTYEPAYDNPDRSMDTVACSDGRHGLAARFPKFRDIPTFPNVGGAFDIHWNSHNCGTCWKITNTANNISIAFTAIDRAGHGGFHIAESAFEYLNGGEIGSGILQVEGHRVAVQVCGL